LACFEVLSRLMEEAVLAEGGSLPAGPMEGAVLAKRGKLPVGLMEEAYLAWFLGEVWRGGMGVAVPVEKDVGRLLLVPLVSPTPQSSARSACEAAADCCALAEAA
jgi:hypothetical protein